MLLFLSGERERDWDGDKRMGCMTTKDKREVVLTLECFLYSSVLQEPKSPNIMHYKEREEDMFLV